MACAAAAHAAVARDASRRGGVCSGGVPARTSAVSLAESVGSARPLRLVRVGGAGSGGGVVRCSRGRGAAVVAGLVLSGGGGRSVGPHVTDAGCAVPHVVDDGCVEPRVAHAGCVGPRVAHAVRVRPRVAHAVCVGPRVAVGGVSARVVAVDGVRMHAADVSGVASAREGLDSAPRRRRDDGDGGLGGAVDGVAQATEPSLDSAQKSGLSTRSGTDVVLVGEALGRAACLETGLSTDGGSGSPDDGGVSKVKSPACGRAAPGSAR